MLKSCQKSTKKCRKIWRLNFLDKNRRHKMSEYSKYELIFINKLSKVEYVIWIVLCSITKDWRNLISRSKHDWKGFKHGRRICKYEIVTHRFIFKDIIFLKWILRTKFIAKTIVLIVIICNYRIRFFRDRALPFQF